MRWFCVQNSGRLSDENGFVTEGYSGFGVGKNNPAFEEVPDVGPIPAGDYDVGEALDHPELGPVAVPLIARPGTDTHGREGFFVHGDSIQHPGEASHGCVIIEPRSVRERLQEGDTFTVVHDSSDLVAAMAEAA
jgi:hypothetical protein